MEKPRSTPEVDVGIMLILKVSFCSKINVQNLQNTFLNIRRSVLFDCV